jgi:hypothetical protein
MAHEELVIDKGTNQSRQSLSQTHGEEGQDRVRGPQGPLLGLMSLLLSLVILFPPGQAVLHPLLVPWPLSNPTSFLPGPAEALPWLTCSFMCN